jgi:hypothetical protein
MSEKRVRKPQLAQAKGVAIKVLRKMVEDETLEPDKRIAAAQVLLQTPTDPVESCCQPATEG